MNRGAVQRILQLKKRAWSLGLIVIAADLRQLAGLIDLSRKDLLKQPRVDLGRALTPGYCRHCRGTPRWIRGEHSAVAVRVTAHPIARTLCRRFGSAIISTSANRSGRPRHCARAIKSALNLKARSISFWKVPWEEQPAQVRSVTPNPANGYGSG